MFWACLRPVLFFRPVKEMHVGQCTYTRWSEPVRGPAEVATSAQASAPPSRYFRGGVIPHCVAQPCAQHMRSLVVGPALVWRATHIRGGSHPSAGLKDRSDATRPFFEQPRKAWRRRMIGEKGPSDEIAMRRLKESTEPRKSLKMRRASRLERWDQRLVLSAYVPRPCKTRPHTTRGRN